MKLFSFLRQNICVLSLVTAICINSGFILHAQQKPSISTAKKPTVSYKIIDAANSTFGYDIYINGKLQVHQLSIPAMQGNGGFKTKAGAEKVARLVISKIKKGEMPPTISITEIKGLKAK